MEWPLQEKAGEHRSLFLEMMRIFVQSIREGLPLEEARGGASFSKKEAIVRLGCGGNILESHASCL